MGAVVAASASAVIASGCGASSLDPVQKAAAATNEQSAHVRMAIKVSTSNSAVDVRAVGAVRRGEGALTMRVSTLGKTVPVKEIFTTSAGDVILYMRSPVLFRRLPAGKTWAKIDLTKAEKAQGFSGPLQSGDENPSDTLEMLKDVASVTKVGSARIGDVQTTHYHANIDLKKLASSEPGSARGIGRFESQTGLETLPVDVWIDGDNHVRRVLVRMSAERSKIGPLRMSLTMNFSRFGLPADVTPPPTGETADLTARLANSTKA